MSMSRNSLSSKHKTKSENKLQQKVNQLDQHVSNPPTNLTKQWIKDREEEQKVLFEDAKSAEFTGKTSTLKSLTEMGKKIQKMKKKFKTLTNEHLKTPASVKSGKSQKSRKKSQSRKDQSQQSQSKSRIKTPDQSRSKSSKKVTKGKKQTKTQNTPNFEKKTFETKVGSQRNSQRPNVRIIDSRITKNVDRSQSLSRSRSIGSSKKKSKKRNFSPYSADESSSLTLSSDIKEAVNMRMNPAQSRYEVFLDQEKKTQDLDAGQLSREENLMLTTKLESVTKEKLLREYRILYYRMKEVKKLLSEYYEQNLTLTDQINELKQLLQDKALEIKQLKKELKSQTKDMKLMQSEYGTKLDQLGKTYHQHEMNTVPINDYDRLKQENEKILVENELLKEDYKVIQLKLQQIENEIYQKRQYEIPEQEITGRLQRELENIKDQFDKVREDNIKLKMQLDKEMLTNRELSQNFNQKKNEIDGTVEQKQYELSSLKTHLNAANTKIQNLEKQVSQMKYQMISEQEQSFSIKEKIIRQEEELRIANLKVENREKELNEQRTKELVLKKKILDLESKVENQQQGPNQPYFDAVLPVNKTNNSESFMNKELQMERQFLAKTQEQLIQCQSENDQLKRNIKQLELELNFEKQQNDQLKQRLSQIQTEHETTLQRVQKQFEDTENSRQKELTLSEQQQKNQENMLYSAQQRINDLESELRLLNKQENDLKGQINEQKLQIERQNLKIEQYEFKLQDLTNSYNELNSENKQLNESNKQLRIQSQQLSRELDQIDRIKDNYKNKYLNNRYESKKIQNQFCEKENIMKQTYTSELERIKSEKEQLEKLKNQEECQRVQRDKKLKVINDLQLMIKGHKKLLDK